MADEAASVVAQGSFGAPSQEKRIAYMRYVGQGHEIAVPLPARPLAASDVTAIRAAYDAEYTKFYDRPVPGSDVEVMSYAVTVATFPPPAAAPPDAAVLHASEPVRSQKVRDTATGAVADWAVYEREDLAPGAYFAGPAIVAEAETSTLLGPGWSGRITDEGYIELTREIA
jgi:N-methylhydantoinase A